MSAFLVEDKTINKIVTKLYESRNFQQHEPSQIKRDLLKMGYDLNASYGAEKLARDMFKLNQQSLDVRYGEGTGEKDATTPFSFQFEFGCSLPEVIKALHCWHYQCMEGDIPQKSKLYKIMEKLSDYWAYCVVSELPEYENAEWN